MSDAGRCNFKLRLFGHELNCEQLSWAWYDWANSGYSTVVETAIFPIYFVSMAKKALLKVFSDENLASSKAFGYLGIANSVATALIVIMAPIVGAIADTVSGRKKFLTFFIFAGALFTAGLYFFQQPEQWFWALLLFGLSLIAFSGANVFYDSLLLDVSEGDPTLMDIVSSLGYALGYIGGGLLLVLSFVLIFTMPDKAFATRLSFLLVGIWWIVFSIPIILFVRERSTGESSATNVAEVVRDSISSLLQSISAAFRHKQMLIFLLAYILYMDGVSTIIKLATAYGKALGMSETSLVGAIVMVQFVAFPFALFYAWLADKIGVKKSLLIAIGVYFIISVWGYFLSSAWQFWVMAFLVATSQGGIQALSRSFFGRFIPEDRSAQFYGLMSFTSKFAAVWGPLLVGGVTLITGNSRLGVLSLSLMFALGAILMLFVPEDPERLVV